LGRVEICNSIDGVGSDLEVVVRIEYVDNEQFEFVDIFFQVSTQISSSGS
jgi:hypothetical protein